MGNTTGTHNSENLFKYIVPALNQEQPSDEQTLIYRNPASSKILKSNPNPEFHSLRDVLEETVRVHGNKPFLGTRYYRREYSWKTYLECYSLAEKLAHGISFYNLGASRKDAFPMIGIYSNNREEWVILDMACLMSGVVTIPLYETLGQPSIKYIIRNTGMTSIFCSREGLSRLVASDNFSMLKTIVCFDNPDLKDLDSLKNFNVDIISLGKVLRKGEERISVLENITGSLPMNKKSVSGNEENSDFKTSSESPLDPLKNNDDVFNKEGKAKSKEKQRAEKRFTFPSLNEESIYTICFTSGTVSEPKGVVLTHGNFLSSLAVVVSSNTICNSEDRHLSYLPLAHIFERVMTIFIIYKGASSAFYQGDVLKLKEDLELVKPTIFVTVPRLLEKLEDGFKGLIEGTSSFRRSIINRALSAKRQEFEKTGNLRHYFYDAVIFNKFRQALGGRVKCILTGSAPLSQETEQFLQITLSCPILQGYGLTESTGPIFFKGFHDKKLNHVGGPAENIEFKLVDIPDWGYRTQESDLLKPIKGEICIRGPALFQGYYKMDQRKKEDWFSTGDIGELTANGSLKIVGRVANILKLANGEKVALEKLENIYSQSKLIIDILICMRYDQSGIVAIVVPDKNELARVLKAQVTEENYENLIASENFKNALHQDLLGIARTEKLFDWEKIMAVHCEPRSFQQLGLITENLKKKRREASVLFKNILELL